MSKGSARRPGEPGAYERGWLIAFGWTPTRLANFNTVTAVLLDRAEVPDTQPESEPVPQSPPGHTQEQK